MAKIDYAALKKGGFMRQKQKGFFSLRIQVVGGNLTAENIKACLLYTSPSPRDRQKSRMPSSA